MPSTVGFRASFTSLWFRLVTLGIVALVFTEALLLAPGKAQGWSYYLTIPEVLFEVAVRLVAAAWAGIALGTVCTVVMAPLLWWFKSARQRLVDTVTKVAVLVVVFFTSRYAVEILIKWSYSLGTHPAIYDKLLLGAQLVGFVIAVCIPRTRREVVSSMDGFLTEPMTRRAAMTTVVATAAVVVAEVALSKRFPARQSVATQPRPKSNFLLVTFDALSAEDMSLYGRSLPSTPNIDAFAQQATVFDRFFSACTFTTPSVATMMTGTYPSETLIYQLQGQLRREDTEKSLPHVMRVAGYRTGAFLTNPFAYYVSTSLKNQFDILPEPVFQSGGLQHLWEATTPLHQDSGIGSRMDEYSDLEHVWNYWGRMPDNLSMRYRPMAALDDARQVLANLPDGFFLWIHLITPHNPYLPDAVDRGRFLPDSQLTTYEEESGPRWKPHYPPDQQPLVNQRRLRYDEFIATGDRAFGAFMAELERSGKLENTTVIVSADHGESFEGGVYEHSTSYLTRPVLHIPLIIRTPGQMESRIVSVTADQTSLAPTILELAGLPKPDAMRGPSLVPYLNHNGGSESDGRAFCQYFERNSVFKPLHHGSVGVIEGQFQYVVYLEDQRGILRPLKEAQVWNLDRSAEYPQQAAALREVLHNQFPDLIKKS